MNQKVRLNLFRSHIKIDYNLLKILYRIKLQQLRDLSRLLLVHSSTMYINHLEQYLLRPQDSPLCKMRAMEDIVQVKDLINEVQEDPAIFVFEAVPSVRHDRVDLSEDAEMDECVWNFACDLVEFVHCFVIYEVSGWLLLDIVEVF